MQKLQTSSISVCRPFYRQQLAELSWAELNRPVCDEWVVPSVSVCGGQRHQHLPLFSIFHQDAAHVGAETELRSVVVDVNEADCDGGDVLVHKI